MLADTTSGREGFFGFGVFGVCLALIVVVLLYLIRSVRLSVMRDSSVRSASLAERRERSERLWQTAQQLAAAGQLAEAVRVVYLSALYALDERALLHVESSLTNREHARQLSRLHPDVGRTFFEVVDRYDRVRYGRIPITEATFTELSGLVARPERPRCRVRRREMSRLRSSMILLGICVAALLVGALRLATERPPCHRQQLLGPARRGPGPLRLGGRHRRNLAPTPGPGASPGQCPGLHNSAGATTGVAHRRLGPLVRRRA